MRPAAPARKAFAATTALKASALAAIGLWLRAGDEGGKAVDAAIVGNDGLRLRGLRLELRLRAVLALMIAIATLLAVAAMFARLLIAHIRLLLAIALIVVAHIGLLLLRRLRREAWLLAERREAVGILVAFLARHFVVEARLLCCGWFCRNCSWAAAIRRK